MMNTCGKFHLNPSTKYRDIASHETGVSGSTTDWQTDNQTA